MQLLVPFLAALAVASGESPGATIAHEAPFLNTWLVLGAFDNDTADSGFDHDWIGEPDAAPHDGESVAGRVWRYWDDRLFSRNLDNYQDLRSYFVHVCDASAAAKVAYAHLYLHVPTACPAQLRLGANHRIKAWVNGALVGSSTQDCPVRDAVRLPIALAAGYNRLLVKIANNLDGRLGFYARVCDPFGASIPDLTSSVHGPSRLLAISTRPVIGAATGALPVAYREWCYVGADARAALQGHPELGGLLETSFWRPNLALLASDFQFLAEGGKPPYVWTVVDGELPEGLTLGPEGTLRGTVSPSAQLTPHHFRVCVTDQDGQKAEGSFAIEVRERPNRWFELTRLTALIHAPETLPQSELPRFAQLMKRQGYGLAMVIAYNNGDYKYRWPSIFEPDNPLGDVVGRYKAALEAEGIRFGMYFGNLNGPNHGGDDGALRMVEQAVRHYRPAALWFDWANPQVLGYSSLDALYSMIRTCNPETVIVLNGVITLDQGDWDVIDLEGWGAWGEGHWRLWPFALPWPKQHAVESWRLVADPSFEFTRGIYPDWREYLRLQISLIAEGFVANVDHSPTIRSGINENGQLSAPENSVVWLAHQAMADWASPPRIPPLFESYTQVDVGPLRNGPWGYNTINATRDVIFLHLLSNPYGKTGVPDNRRLTFAPVQQRVLRVLWMNRNVTLPFEQQGETLTVNLERVVADPVDTILKLELAGPHPIGTPETAQAEQVPPGNLAFRKPAWLKSADGTRLLIPSAFAFARYGVDGSVLTHAQGGGEWAWTYEVDLGQAHALQRIVVHFGKGYATAYGLRLSVDGTTWSDVAQVTGCTGGRQEHRLMPTPARYVRVVAHKPNGPDQTGEQMSIAELEVYE